MSSIGKRAAVVVASTLLSGAAAYWWLDPRSVGASVRMVDVRAEVAPLLRARSLERAGAAAGPGAAAAPGALLREPVSEEQARSLFASLRFDRSNVVYDPQTYYWHRPNHQWRRRFPEHASKAWRNETNELGLKSTEPVRSQKPGARILVAGDSHTGGVVPMDELFTSLLSDALSEGAADSVVEVLNGAKGGFSLYSYLGVLEKFEALEPDAFVCAIYGGNDLFEMVPLFSFFHREPLPVLLRPQWKRTWREHRRGHPHFFAQFLNQELQLRGEPELVARLVEASQRVIRTIDDTCQANGVRPLLVYIPPMFDAQPQFLREEIDRLCGAFGVETDELGIAKALASATLSVGRELGMTVIDMTPVFAAQEQPAYWLSDHHINTLGHRLVAEALERALR